MNMLNIQEGMITLDMRVPVLKVLFVLWFHRKMIANEAGGSNLQTKDFFIV